MDEQSAVEQNSTSLAEISKVFELLGTWKNFKNLFKADVDISSALKADVDISIRWNFLSAEKNPTLGIFFENFKADVDISWALKFSKYLKNIYIFRYFIKIIF